MGDKIWQVTKSGLRRHCREPVPTPACCATPAPDGVPPGGTPADCGRSGPGVTPTMRHGTAKSAPIGKGVEATPQWQPTLPGGETEQSPPPRVLGISRNRRCISGQSGACEFHSWATPVALPGSHVSAACGSKGPPADGPCAPSGELRPCPAPCHCEPARRAGEAIPPPLVAKWLQSAPTILGHTPEFCQRGPTLLQCDCGRADARRLTGRAARPQDVNDRAYATFICRG